jgi:hypothetical protein
MGKLLSDENITRLAEGLEVLRKTQGFVSSKSPDGPQELADWAEPEFVRSYILAMIVELTEFMNELNWKPWLTAKKSVDLTLLALEFADILAFQGVLLKIMEAHGIDARAIADAYDTKSDRNLARFVLQKNFVDHKLE